MSSKEVQLSLSFCGALAAILLISAPVNEMIALVGSGTAFIISSGFFYGGIKKYFDDKEKQTQIIGNQTELLIKNFEEKFNQSQNSTTVQLKEVVEAIENLDDTFNDSVGKLAENVSETSDTLNNIKGNAEIIENNSDKLKDLHKSAKSILDEIETLSGNVKEISKVNEALQELMRTMNRQEEFYKALLNQYNNMTAKDVELIENLARKLR
ncbi:MAG: hypothetical protein IJQ85_10375 [Selenomonadaceae bacterium]|nr:hypothetical protein [Selenomonadaceae bacterium]